MPKEFVELIKSYIPEAQSKAMKEFIEDYEKLKQQSIVDEKEISLLNKKLEDVLSENKVYKENEIKVSRAIEEYELKLYNLQEREYTLKNSENELRITELQHELNSLRVADEKIENFFGLVFKNTTQKRSYIESNCLSQGGKDQNGYPLMNGRPTSRTISEEFTEE